MSVLYDVIHDLIDVASGVKARLSPDEAAALHEGVAKARAGATALDGPDVSPEPDASPDEGTKQGESPYQPPYPPAGQESAVTNSGEPVA